MSDATKQLFLMVIESSIIEADKVIDDAISRGISWLEQDASIAKSFFEEIKQQLLTNTLPKSEGAGLGLTKALSEIEAPEELYEAGKTVEDFYISNW